mgnify:CR=1 FL=1
MIKSYCKTYENWYNNSMKNFYEVLQVRSNATQMQIKKAYISLITKYHPDVYKGDKQYAQRYTALLTEAYAVLKDENRRREYDVRHCITAKPNLRQLKREDRRIQREKREQIRLRKQNNEQQISAEYLKNTKRKKTSLKDNLKKVGYTFLVLVGFFIVLAMYIFYKN